WLLADPFGQQDPFGQYNDGRGATNVCIRRNAIYGNNGMGIALGSVAVDIQRNHLTLQQVEENLDSNPDLWYDDIPNGVVLNDSLGHIGGNNYQNFPALTSATSSSTSTLIFGTFREAAEPCTTLTLDFYANDTADPSGYGEGQTYLGS